MGNTHKLSEYVKTESLKTTEKSNSIAKVESNDV